jgi:hypothetical protein
LAEAGDSGFETQDERRLRQPNRHSSIAGVCRSPLIG